MTIRAIVGEPAVVASVLGQYVAEDLHEAVIINEKSKNRIVS